MIQGLENRLKQLRIKRHLSQKYVSEYLNLSRSIISDYERGAVQPPLDILVKLSVLYGSSIDYILGISKIDYIFPKNLSDEQRAVIMEIDKLVASLFPSQKEVE